LSERELENEHRNSFPMSIYLTPAHNFKALSVVGFNLRIQASVKIMKVEDISCCIFDHILRHWPLLQVCMVVGKDLAELFFERILWKLIFLTECIPTNSPRMIWKSDTMSHLSVKDGFEVDAKLMLEIHSIIPPVVNNLNLNRND